MQTIAKRQAAEQFNQVMLEFLATEHGLVAPNDLSLCAKGEFVFSVEDDFDAFPARQIKVLDDKDVRVSPGLLRIDTDDTRPEWRHEHVRLGLQIGADGTGKPLATAALGKSEVLTLLSDLLDWAAVLTGAGAFHEHLHSPSEAAKVRKVLGAAEDLRRTLIAHAVVGAPSPSKY